MQSAIQNGVRLIAVVALALLAGLAQARETVVKVGLWDKGPMSMKMLGHGPEGGMMMGGHGGDMRMATMGIRVASATLRAGKVRFVVRNESKTMEHELVISPVKDPKLMLPYNQTTMKVDEDAAGHLGEVAELAPGQSGELLINLKPGRYILYCNINGHYALGMWTLITVK